MDGRPFVPQEIRLVPPLISSVPCQPTGRIGDGNHMDVTHEIELRLKAIGEWCDHACAGECKHIEALDAIDQLSFNARMLLAGEAA